MPIYEYRCDSCGFQKEYIQRMSDARLTDCPECMKATFNKMVTAAGFQLKGGGWYVTDFKSGGSNTNGAKKPVEKQSDTSVGGESSAAEKPKAEASGASASAAAGSAATTATKSGAPAAAAPSAPAPTSGST